MKIKYVQMESEAFLTDMDFVTMSLYYRPKALKAGQL
jgi:hypothetical protein